MPFQAQRGRARMDVLRTVAACFLWFQTPGFSFILVHQGEFNSQKSTASQRQIQPLKNPAVIAASKQQTVPQCAELWMPVPPVVGQTLSDAKETLAGAGFQMVRVNPPNGTGVVVRQDPKCAQAQTPIDIWVKNPDSAVATTVQVPDLHGKSLLEAAIVLTLKGLRPGGSSKEQSNIVAPNRIVSQEPAAGSLVPKGTTVVVTVAVPPPNKETLIVKSNLNRPAIPGEPVTFIASAQGPAQTIQYQFDFGDGQKSPASESPQARHAYAKDGNYMATVTAILDGGVGQVTASTDVSVHEAPAGVHEAPQFVTLDVSPRRVEEKQPVTFTAHVYPPEPAPARYTFHFGDRSEEVSETPSVTHPYQQNSVYHPSVTILTAHGHNASSHPIRLIVVVPVPPLPWWVIALVAAGLVASVAFVAFVGHKLLQRWVTRRIRLNLRPGEVTMPLQSLHGGLEEDEFQFHTNHSPGVIVVQERASVVHRVKVRK